MPPVLASPDWYLHSFEQSEAVLVPMDRAAYRRSIFLDHRIAPAPGEALRLAVSALKPPLPAARTAWIFHMAHCGSTLLARALDEAGGAAGPLVLREPLALRQVALAPDPARLALVLALLARRYGGKAPTLVKANVPVNTLLPALAAADPLAPAVLLHLPLEDYLLAILRSDQHRQWLRDVSARLPEMVGPVAGLADAECAAALWLGQMRRFAAALAAMPNARTLDAERFYAAPAAVLAAASALFERPASPAALAALVSGPLFATYSKRPDVAFDNAARLARRATLAKALGGELAQARRWIERTAPDCAALVTGVADRALEA